MQKYISVQTLNLYLKRKIDEDNSLQHVYIKGEISNYRPHPSGHVYFTLKDEQSRVQAVMFQSHAKNLDFKLENGQSVLLMAKVSVYEVSGQYQLYVSEMKLDGIGNLHERFEVLKNKLQKEGLFDQSHKKTLPTFPMKIAILSAKQGAATQDVVRTLQERFPFSRTILFPIPVQGVGAYKTIIDVLQKVDALNFDIILLCRGGGSIEDLWNFNEEELARTIYALNTPIISGIGHEVDYTIADFVADHRAVTPTAAAVKCVPDHHELRSSLQIQKERLVQSMNNRLENKRLQLNRLKNSYLLKNPEALFINQITHLNQLKMRMSHQYDMKFVLLKNKNDSLQQDLKNAMTYYTKCQTESFQRQLMILDSLSPLKILSRGYAIVQNEKMIIKSINDVKTNDTVSIMLSDGKINAKVE